MLKSPRILTSTARYLSRGAPVFVFVRSKRKMSRYSASTIVPPCDTFNLKNYDCIGFDLDNTVCLYNIANLAHLEYDILSKFLITKKGYNPKHLSKPLDDNVDFIQKGLVLGCKTGNVLRVGADGFIHKAYHGTNKELSESEIIHYYGSSRQWDVAKEFNKDMLIAWNGPLSYEIRTILDYYDLPASLCFARCVDTLDEQNGGPSSTYNVWPDILDGLMYMFNRENFAANTGHYFPELKRNPEKYYRKVSDDVLTWIKSLRKNDKLTFLVTGSNMDYANLTAKYCIGENWTDLFDVIIYYARKPGFFIGDRPFITVKNHEESHEIKPQELAMQQQYCQGNWNGLHEFFKKVSKKSNLKTVYFGDNLIQDIYTPMAHKLCDTVAIVEEMAAEGMFDVKSSHPDTKFITSQMWGSFFSIDDGKSWVPSMWENVIRRHAQLCIPSLEYIAKLPLDYDFKAFKNDEETYTGFYPGVPLGLLK